MFLVVEDDGSKFSAVRRVLARAGENLVVRATCVDDAQRLLDTEKYTGAVLDFDLMGETSQPLWAICVQKKLPFVVFSGSWKPPFAGEAIEWIDSADHRRLEAFVRGVLAQNAP